jgi:hypothetical protein
MQRVALTDDVQSLGKHIPGKDGKLIRSLKVRAGRLNLFPAFFHSHLPSPTQNFTHPLLQYPLLISNPLAQVPFPNELTNVGVAASGLVTFCDRRRVYQVETRCVMPSL